MNELYRQFRNRRVLSDEAKWKELTLFLLVESRKCVISIILSFLKNTCKNIWNLTGTKALT